MASKDSWLVTGRSAVLVTLLVYCTSHPLITAATTPFTREQYREALEECLIFFEGQRSGPLPNLNRAPWRGDSGLNDGADNDVDLVGGYYDAGDNVKFNFPMAYTATMLSWGTIKYQSDLAHAGQLDYALSAVKWVLDYLLKAVTGPTQIWVQVGDGESDHDCWERPEDMDTSRKSYQVNASHPGSEPAAEIAAAMAAGSILFRIANSSYAQHLLQTAEMAFLFADTYRKSFTDSCPFYCSYSGYYDELLWAAAWLYKASEKTEYLNYVQENEAWSYTVSEFEWDNKMAGIQILLSKSNMSGIEGLSTYRNQADQFACLTLPESPEGVVKITPGGLLYVSNSNNLHCVASSSLAIAIYADDLQKYGQNLTCGNQTFYPEDLLKFSKSQIDYMLGSNPLNMSYMAGFGSKYPLRLHHRGASIISYKKDPSHVSCSGGYTKWFSRNASNPNIHVGAFVGGPDGNDNFVDDRADWRHLEPMTYLNAAACPLIARIRRTAQVININQESASNIEHVVQEF